MSPNIFQDCVSGSKLANGLLNPGPQVARIFFTSPFASLTERLTGIASTDDIWAFDFLPVNFFDVAMIDHLWPVFF
jgi:hypothetical protein